MIEKKKKKKIWRNGRTVCVHFTTRVWDWDTQYTLHSTVILIYGVEWCMDPPTLYMYLVHVYSTLPFWGVIFGVPFPVLHHCTSLLNLIDFLIDWENYTLIGHFLFKAFSSLRVLCFIKSQGAAILNEISTVINAEKEHLDTCMRKLHKLI